MTYNSRMCGLLTAIEMDKDIYGRRLSQLKFKGLLSNAILILLELIRVFLPFDK